MKCAAHVRRERNLNQRAYSLQTGFPGINGPFLPWGFKAALVLTGLVYFVGNKGWKALKGPSVRSGYPGCLMKNLNLQNFLHTAIIHGNGFCKFIHKPFLSQNRGNGI